MCREDAPNFRELPHRESCHDCIFLRCITCKHDKHEFFMDDDEIKMCICDDFKSIWE